MGHENCHQYLGSLSEFIDGSLEEQICDEIERHMSDCENCRIVIDSLRKTVSLYKVTNEKPTLPDEVRQRLYLRLELDEYLDQQ